MQDLLHVSTLLVTATYYIHTFANDNCLRLVHGRLHFTDPLTVHIHRMIQQTLTAAIWFIPETARFQIRKAVTTR
jgi:hypothetical protein